MTVLHAGGKFDSKAYNTSGGLHGVGVSVVNALSETLEVQVARDQQLYRMVFSRGEPQTKLEKLGSIMNRRGTKVRFKPDEKIFGKGAAFKPARAFEDGALESVSFRRRRNPLEVRARADQGRHARRSRLPFPGRPARLSDGVDRGPTRVTKDIFSGRVEKDGGHGSVEWAVAWIADEDGFSSSYCNTIPTAEGGTHENGLRQALYKGLRAYGELTGNKKAQQITSEDVMGTAASMLSVFIREPEFQGQTKDKLATAEATKIVETAVRDAFDHWLADSPAAGDEAARVDRRSVGRAPEAPAREGNRPAVGDAQAAPSRQACRLLDPAGGRHGNLHRRRQFGRRQRQERARSRDAGDAAAARQDPERRERFVGQAVAEPASGRPHPGARRRHRHRNIATKICATSA